jgi:hypothetical protein
MGLYSSFSTSQYYDEPVVKKPAQQAEKSTEYKKPHQTENNGLTEQKRKSLYAEAQKVASTAAVIKGPDFREIYRVGQMIRVQAPSGHVRTNKGRIVEIVDRDLMYVGMEDTYKDVNDNWLIDFVTPTDRITKL